MIGTPPWIGNASGKLTTPGRCFTESSQVFPGRWVTAAERALRVATSAVCDRAPSARSSSSRSPASSTTAIVTAQFCRLAASRDAARIFCASDKLNAVLLRIFVTLVLIKRLPGAGRGGQIAAVLIGTPRPTAEGAPLADHRSRQQYRSSVESAKEEDAKGRHLSRDETPGPLRKTIRKARKGTGGSDSTLPQAPAQALAARRPVAALEYPL